MNKKNKFKIARHLKQENDDGNIEYKYKLNPDCSPELASQMLYRLYQGEGKAIYNIGYLNNGCPMGLTYNILLKNLNQLFQLTTELDAVTKSVKIFKAQHGYCANVFITKKQINTDLLPYEINNLDCVS